MIEVNNYLNVEEILQMRFYSRQDSDFFGDMM